MLTKQKICVCKLIFFSKIESHKYSTHIYPHILENIVISLTKDFSTPLNVKTVCSFNKKKKIMFPEDQALL